MCYVSPNSDSFRPSGLSHNSSRVLYRVGELATPAVQQLSETGSSTELELLAQGHRGILDQFSAPPVKHGEGSTMARVFVDGAHSQVRPKAALHEVMYKRIDGNTFRDGFKVCETLFPKYLLSVLLFLFLNSIIMLFLFYIVHSYFFIVNLSNY